VDRRAQAEREKITENAMRDKATKRSAPCRMPGCGIADACAASRGYVAARRAEREAKIAHV